MILRCDICVPRTVEDTEVGTHPPHSYLSPILPSLPRSSSHSAYHLGGAICPSMMACVPSSCPLHRTHARQPPAARLLFEAELLAVEGQQVKHCWLEIYGTCTSSYASTGNQQSWATRDGHLLQRLANHRHAVMLRAATWFSPITAAPADSPTPSGACRDGRPPRNQQTQVM